MLREAAALHLDDGRGEDLLATHLDLPAGHARTLLSRRPREGDTCDHDPTDRSRRRAAPLDPAALDRALRPFGAVDDAAGGGVHRPGRAGLGAAALLRRTAGRAWAGSRTCAATARRPLTPARADRRRHPGAADVRRATTVAASGVRQHLPAPRARAAARGRHRRPSARSSARTTPGRTTSTGRCIAAPGFETVETFDTAELRAGRAARRRSGTAGCSSTRPATARAVRASTSATWTTLVGAVRPRAARRRRAGTRTRSPPTGRSSCENYHECYHCPLIHPELCQVSPPTSGDNYDLPGAWVGGSMDLRDDAETMSLTGASDGLFLEGVDPRKVLYLGLFPNLLHLAAPRLRDDPPDAAAGAGPHLGRVLVVLPDADDGRPGVRGGLLGPHEPAGLRRLRVGAARAGVAALPARARSRPTRTPCTSGSAWSAAPTAASPPHQTGLSRPGAVRAGRARAAGGRRRRPAGPRGCCRRGPTTVGEPSSALSTDSSVASTTASKNGSRPAPGQRRRAVQPRRRGRPAARSRRPGRSRRCRGARSTRCGPAPARPGGPAARRRRASSGASVTTTPMHEPAGAGAGGVRVGRQQPADRDAVDGEPLALAEVGHQQHADRVPVGTHPGRGADAALEAQARHPGARADRALGRRQQPSRPTSRAAAPAPRATSAAVDLHAARVVQERVVALADHRDRRRRRRPPASLVHAAARRRRRRPGRAASSR